jgi:hypothetical protein
MTAKKHSIAFVETDADIAKWHRTIGKKVYKLSGKPFKSKETTATPTGIVIHPITGRKAFTFDFDGVVECRTCELYLDDPTKWTFVERGLLEEGVAPLHIQSMISRHLTGLFALDDTVENRDEAIVAYKQLEADLNRMIQGEVV